VAKVDELPRVEVTSREAWRAWLERHHQQDTGIWLVTYKKHCGDRYVPWGDIVREALCFGWIDSRTRRVDDDRTSVLVTPRKPGSVWSAVNKRHVAALEASGQMTAAGRSLVRAAKEDGSWEWLDDIESLIVPDDLAVALRGAGVREAWDETIPSARKRALYDLKSAKRQRTRERRLARVVSRLVAGERPA